MSFLTNHLFVLNLGHSENRVLGDRVHDLSQMVDSKLEIEDEQFQG